MADDRKVFPVEQVLELVTGKKGADVKTIAGYILGRTVDDSLCAEAAAPFASAWLARWYPRFMEMDWKDGDSWELFVKQARGILGDQVSITPMSGRLKNIANHALDAIADTNASLARQTEAVMELEKQVRSIEPLRAAAEASQKKCDELENKIKTMKTDMVALQRKVAEYQGKLAIDHDTLMENIKDAIKDGLKGLSLGATIAGTVEAASEAKVESESPAEDQFGFGSSDAEDGFGF